MAEMALRKNQALNANNYTRKLSIVLDRRNSQALDVDNLISSALFGKKTADATVAVDNLISSALLRKKTDATEKSKPFMKDSIEEFKNNSLIRPMSLNDIAQKNQKIRKEINNVMQDIIRIARASHKTQIIQDIQRNYQFKLHSAKVTRNNPYSYSAGQENFPIINNTTTKVLLTQK